MKECLSCHKKVNNLSHACKHCGGTSFMQSGSAQDALSMINDMQKQAEAAHHVDRSAQLIEEGRYVEAERELKMAIEINPMNAVAHGNMGCMFFMQGQPEKAIPWLKKALQLDPNIEGVPNVLAQARRKQEQQTSSASKKKGCFIATAAYGTPMTNKIQVLRFWRDNKLYKSKFGVLFIQNYYRFSPPIAKMIVRSERMKGWVRFLINPIIKYLEKRYKGEKNVR